MDTRPDDIDELDDGPAGHREAIARTREDLARHLDLLKEMVFHPQPAKAGGRTSMTTKKTTRKTAAKVERPEKKQAAAKAAKAADPAPKKTAVKKSAAASRKRSSPKAKGLVAKAGEVLDTMVAGAVVGAVKGAARDLADEPTVPLSSAKTKRSRKAQHAATTGEVLDDIAPGAAMGAVAGAAKTVLPDDEPKPKGSR